MTEFDSEDVVIRQVARTAVYVNGDDEIVIAQDSIYGGDTSFVIIPPAYVGALVARLNQLLASEAEAK